MAWQSAHPTKDEEMMNIEHARFNMIEQQIHPCNVMDAHVLETLALVKRERYVPQPLRELAFADVELPIGKGQTMLEPKQEAKILQALALKGTESVLEIGSGSGYMAALLAAHAEWVRTLEIDPDLVRLAHTNLEQNGVLNVVVVEADGSHGWPERAPYDVIVASGAVEAIPAAWLEQLKPGGHLFAFIGKAPVMTACLSVKSADGSVQTHALFETQVMPLRIASRRKEFAF